MRDKTILNDVDAACLNKNETAIQQDVMHHNFSWTRKSRLI